MTYTNDDSRIPQWWVDMCHVTSPVINKKERKHTNGLTPKMWNGAEHDYYSNPALPWKCDKCEMRFKYKNQVKDHKLKDHAY